MKTSNINPWFSDFSDMISFLWIILILVVAEFVVGNFANVFIVLVNYIDWVRKERISSADQILTALAVSRLGLLWAIITNLFVTVLNPALQSYHEMTIVIAWAITNHFSTWLATGLSIFYLLKIANFPSLVFLYLKRRVKSVILRMLLVTLVLLLLQISIVNVNETRRVKEYEGNTTWKTELRDAVDISTMTVFHLVIIIPFFISLICFLLLICSLCKHLRKMQVYGNGSHDPSTRMHVKALKTVISFLLLFAVYSSCVIMSFWRSKTFQGKVFFFSQVIGALYPSCHSCVLIWGHRKLKQAFLSVLWLARCWLTEWRHSISISGTWCDS